MLFNLGKRVITMPANQERQLSVYSLALLLINMSLFSVVAAADQGPVSPEIYQLLLTAAEQDEFATIRTQQKILLKGQAALPTLRSAFKHKSDKVRAIAIRLAGRLNDVSATAVLHDYLANDSVFVAREAAVALGRLKQPNAFAVLLKAFKSRPEPEVREKIVWALATLGDTRIVPVLIDELERGPLVLKKFEVTDSGFSNSMIWALGHLGDRRGIQAIRKFLHSEHAETRTSAVAALARLKDPSSLDDLVERLQDPNYRVALYAARGLGRLADPKAVEPLLVALRRPEGKVVRACAVALGRIGDPRAIDPLIQRLQDKQIEHAHFEIVEALGKFKHPKVVEALTAIRDNADDSFVVEAAEKALQTIQK